MVYVVFLPHVIILLTIPSYFEWPTCYSSRLSSCVWWNEIVPYLGYTVPSIGWISAESW